MKKSLLILSCCAFLASCNNSSSEYAEHYDRQDRDTTAAVSTNTSAPETEAPAGAAATALADGNYEKGAKLISQSDCMACHQEKTKVVGPAYVEVAQKYEFTDKNVNYLAGKIIEGGAGVWGQVPMSPHPNVSKADAAEMAKYILSLRN
ncbi:c-type cytochrome [Pontibacter qinzhouensis]|uniref:C-type cytochrome n=1 Tax=Pontibacter qinzhouensis TaxID=2603253 RepID=A0A5C8KCA9_9BACT|nr:c-type cytochrome [Pontibacter qinzhouensis]TXK48735.1 c-type cytochrome [Pontibacter qinzhouensis]